MTRRLPLLLALSLLLAGPAPAGAQARDPNLPASSEDVATATPADTTVLPAAEAAASPAGDPAATASPAPAPTGLPTRAAPPRTLRAYWHVFAAFAIAWLLLFGYTLSLGRRFAALDRDVQRLEGGPPM